MLCMAMLVGFTSSAVTAEIKVLSDGPLEPALTKIAETFRRESNHTLTFEYGLSPVIHKKVLDGEVADIVLIQPNFIDELVQAGKLLPAQHPVRLELLRELVPGLRRLAIIANKNNPQTALEIGDAQAEARKLGLEATITTVRQTDEIGPAIEAFKGHADALYVVSDAFATANQVRINDFALTARLPTIHANREYIETGGLIAYGPNYPDLFRRAADYVDRILRGAKPADLPIEQPTKFELVISLKTAKALGLEVPPTLLARADEVIE